MSTTVTPVQAFVRITMRVGGRIAVVALLVLMALRLDGWLSLAAWVMAAGITYKVGTLVVGMGMIAHRSRDGLWNGAARIGTAFNGVTRDFR